MTIRAPLSCNQEFLCLFDKNDGGGPFGPRYTLAEGWRLRGRPDPDVLREALTDLAGRHEALRTSVSRAEEDRHQLVHPVTPPALDVRDLSDTDPADRERRAQELVGEVEAVPLDVDRMPLLHAVLGRFSDDDAVLVVNTHHVATDGWSMQLIIRDLAELYAARVERRRPRLPDVHQYREFADWERASLTEDALAGPREYWRAKLRGAEILALPADRTRPEGEPMVAAVHRFVVDPETSAATLRYAAEMRSSPFMVLMAAYYVALNRLTGLTDLVVPTITSNRGQPRFQETIGSFFNFLPLRTDLAGCATFRDVTRRTRTTCLDAYANDIPFSHIAGDTPELMRQFADADRAVFGCQVSQFPAVLDETEHGGLRIGRVRRTLPQDVSSHIPDGALWDLEVEPGGDIVGSLKFNSRVFDRATIEERADLLQRVLRSAVADPHAPLPGL
ncbi:condensation domain-containing protein [Actinomadura sediminis]|uniref:Condensation domain-containing protein n=1 Tax=Actinomadura sediminis TaxID=1038904 RepID=A0ABW3EWB6_9ACTN